MLFGSDSSLGAGRMHAHELCMVLGIHDGWGVSGSGSRSRRKAITASMGASEASVRCARRGFRAAGVAWSGGSLP
jgi:hypothetical protein